MECIYLIRKVVVPERLGASKEYFLEVGGCELLITQVIEDSLSKHFNSK